jgi:hypothetical protein
MTAIVVLLLLLALVVGGIGLLVEGVKWLLIIGIALLIAAVVAGLARRAGSSMR